MTNSLLSLQFQQVTDDRRGLVNRFYKANGHKGKCGRDDLVYTAEQDHNIVAAVRFTAKSDGYLLRGLWVDENLRGRTIGKQLLTYSLKRINSPVWCYPYQHLVDFYGRSGFQEISADHVPDVISNPWKAYRARGEMFALMQCLPIKQLPLRANNRILKFEH